MTLVRMLSYEREDCDLSEQAAELSMLPERGSMSG